MKCRYCDKEAKWYNPIKEYYYCEEHSWDKVKQYQEDCKASESDTPKDWFILASSYEQMQSVRNEKEK